MALQIRRGTDAERTAGGGVVFADGELVYVTDTDALYVGDGATAGGVKLTDNAGAVLGSYITADTINSTLDLQQNLDLNGNNIIGTGNINIAGTITATGDVNIGDDANTDTVNLAAKITSSLTPNADSTFNIGTMNERWNNGYFTGLVVDGQVDAVAVNANVVADDSSVMVNVSNNIFTGAFAGNVTGNILGDLTGDTTGTHTGNTTGYHTGDVKGSVFGDDSSVIVDAVNNTVIANVTGDVTGDIYSANGDRILQNGLQGSLDATLTGNVIGGLDGVVGATTPAAVTGTTITANTGFVGNVTGNVVGNLTGDLTGSVFADDSTLLIDAVAGNIPASVVSGTFTGNVTGDTAGTHTGNILTTAIDSADSSAITFTPSVEFESTVSVDQDVTVGVTAGGLTQTIITPNKFSNYNGVNLDGAIYTKLIGTDENDNSAFPLTFDTQTETIKTATFYEGIQVIGDQATSAITLISQEQAGAVSAIKFNVYTGVVGDQAQEDDAANFTDKTVISTEVADFGTAVKFASMTTTVRDALTATAGMVVFNTTDTKLQVYTGSAWADLH